MTDHVKIYGIKPRIQYVSDGILTTYEFPFAIFNTSDINVYFGSVLQDTSSYTVSEARHSDGGSVTFESAPATGTVITIVRNLSIERTSDFQESSPLRSNVLNDELDYQIACQQQIAENLNRSMVLPPYATDNDLDLTLPTPSAGKAIVWNSDGTNLENSTVEVNALESTLKGYKESAESAATTATEKATIASDKAEIATAKAQIATDKATEATTTLASKANKDMDNLTPTGKIALIELGIPDYTAGVSKSLGTYTETVDGVLIASISSSNGLSGYSITIQGNTFVFGQGKSGSDYIHPTNGWFVIPKNVEYTIARILDEPAPTLRFFPFSL